MIVNFPRIRKKTRANDISIRANVKTANESSVKVIL